MIYSNEVAHQNTLLTSLLLALDEEVAQRSFFSCVWK